MNRTSRILEGFVDAGIWYLALAAAIVAFIWIALRIKAWYRDGADPAGNPHAMLAQFRELMREGGLSEAEFRSIKSRLMDRIDGSPSAQDALPQDRSLTAATGGNRATSAPPSVAGRNAEGRDDTARSTHSEG